MKGALVFSSDIDSFLEESISLDMTKYQAGN